MIFPKIVTASELDPLTASFINTRFYGFLQRLTSELDLHREQVMETALEILREAEIPQDGDNLLSKDDKIDLTPFNQ